VQEIVYRIVRRFVCKIARSLKEMPVTKVKRPFKPVHNLEAITWILFDDDGKNSIIAGVCLGLQCHESRVQEIVWCLKMEKCYLTG
jgi:hypothetical protein